MCDQLILEIDGSFSHHIFGLKFHSRDLSGWMIFRRLYSGIAQSAAPAAVSRQTIKPLSSRKTFLVDTYAHLVRSNAVVLALHNSTLLLNEDRLLRAELLKAGAKLTVVRSSLMRVALRGLNAADPAALAKADGVKHPLLSVFTGPSAVVTLPSLDPAAVDRVVQIIDKSQNKLILLAGLVRGIEGAVFREDLDVLRKLPTLPELHAQLAGVLTVLGGAGLTQTLQSTPQMLALTIDQLTKTQE